MNESFKQYKVLSFDCYGTLIDWESGIIATFKEVLGKYGVEISSSEILRLYANTETHIQQGEFCNYKEVLAKTIRSIAEQLEVRLAPSDDDALSESLKSWSAFQDSTAVLAQLKERYQLAIISNVDEDLFAHSADILQVPFDYVITAEQVGHYKPSTQNFKFALEKMGIEKPEQLHISCSLFHDVAPAQSIGIDTVFVNRSKGSEVSAAPSAIAAADWEVGNLEELLVLMGINS